MWTRTWTCRFTLTESNSKWATISSTRESSTRTAPSSWELRKHSVYSILSAEWISCFGRILMCLEKGQTWSNRLVQSSSSTLSLMEYLFSITSQTTQSWSSRFTRGTTTRSRMTNWLLQRGLFPSRSWTQTTQARLPFSWLLLPRAQPRSSAWSTCWRTSQTNASPRWCSSLSRLLFLMRIQQSLTSLSAIFSSLHWCKSNNSSHGEMIWRSLSSLVTQVLSRESYSTKSWLRGELSKRPLFQSQNPSQPKYLMRSQRLLPEDKK